MPALAGDYDPYDEQPITAAVWIERIVSAPSQGERDNLIDGMCRWARPTVRRITASILRDRRLDRNTWADEIESRTYEAMLLLILDVVEERLRQEDLISFDHLLAFRARSKVNEFLDSSAGLNQASKQNGLKRRIKQMKWTQNHLTQVTGRVPTPEEVIDATNKRMESQRKDYERQGMKCTLEDYQYMDVSTSVSLEFAPEPATADPNEVESPLHSTERIDLIKTTIERCYEHSETLGLVAEIWFDPATQEAYDGHPSSFDIAPRVGLAPQTCRTKISQVKHYAREVLREVYGIEGI